jgi:hypothetical protein
MKDVTTQLQMYRECVRHVWNTHFLAPIASSSDKWTLRDEFDDVCCILFGALVVEPLGLAPASQARGILSGSRSATPRTLPWFRLVPNAAAGVPIMVNRDPTLDSGYWDYPLQRVAADDVDLRFVRWFDFDELAFRDFRYYLVRIDSARCDNVAGRAALIECDYVQVLFDQNAFGASAPPLG